MRVTLFRVPDSPLWFATTAFQSAILNLGTLSSFPFRHEFQKFPYIRSAPLWPPELAVSPSFPFFFARNGAQT